MLGHEFFELFAFDHEFASEVVIADAAGAFRAQADLLGGVFAGIAVGADELIHAVVGARGHHVVLNEDGLTLGGAKHGHGDIASLEVRAVLAGNGLVVLRAVEGIGVHGYERSETVAAVDIEGLADRAEAVGRIEVAAVLAVEFKPPVVPVAGPVVIEIVVVCALGMDNFAEHALAGHLESGELEEIVAAVLENDAVFAGALRGIDEIPAGLESLCRRDFERYVLAMLHGIEGNRHVVNPVCADVDKIDGRILTKSLVTVFCA